LRGASTYLSLMPGDMLLPLHCDRGTDEIKRVMSLGSGLQVSFWCVRSIMIVLCVSCTDAILKMFSVSPFNLPFWMFLFSERWFIKSKICFSWCTKYNYMEFLLHVLYYIWNMFCDQNCVT
jgi:hypothetical protein